MIRILGCALMLATILSEGAAQTDSLQTLAQVPFLRVNMHPEGGALSFRVLSSDGHPAADPQPIVLYMDGEKVSADRLTVEVDSLSPRAISIVWRSGNDVAHDFEVRFRSTYSTAFYGAGERFQSLNHRGFSLPMKTDDRADNKGVGAYKPIPFYMTSDGYGVWLDTFAPALFDLNASDRFEAKLSFRDREARLVLIAGPRYTDILETFTGLTGRSSVPPAWAFGLWKSRDVHPNQDSVLADVERLRALDVPASVLVIDSPWETGYNNFEINTAQFADTARMFDRIDALGFKLALWLTPFVNRRNVKDMVGIGDESSNFAEAAENGFLVMDSSGSVALSTWWKGEGGLVDFTNPHAVDWWFGQLDKTLPTGVRAFKCDDGEGNFVPDAVFHDGTQAYKMKNRYAVLYDSVMQAYIDDRFDGDGALITRSGYTGTQRYSFDWAGDNRSNFSFEDGLPTAILAAQNAALSGISLWGSDIAGYFGRPDAELFVRWAQFGAFSPLMQVHMTSNQGPWDFGAEALNIFRKFTKLRTQLFPYLYDAVKESAATGLPIIRPMVLAFQGDPAAAEARYQYMFGPDLLVAPMYQRGTHRSVYLPEGEWVDWWDGTILSGRQTIEVHAPLDEMPLFVRAGAVIPMLPEDVDSLVPRRGNTDPDVVTVDDRRLIEIWPGGEGVVHSWDDLSVMLTKEDSLVTLTLDVPKRLEIKVRLRHHRPTRVRRGNAWVPWVGEGDMIIDFGDVQGVRTTRWKED